MPKMAHFHGKFTFPVHYRRIRPLGSYTAYSKQTTGLIQLQHTGLIQLQHTDHGSYTATAYGHRAVDHRGAWPAMHAQPPDGGTAVLRYAFIGFGDPKPSRDRITPIWPKTGQNSPKTGQNRSKTGPGSIDPSGPPIWVTFDPF